MIPFRIKLQRRLYNFLKSLKNKRGMRFFVAQPLGYSVQTAEIDNDAVTYAKMQNVSATDKVLGRSTAGAGDVEEIACTSAGRALIDDADASAQRTTLGLGNIAVENSPLAVAKGGTALSALGTALQVLRTNAAANALEFATLSSTQDFPKHTAGTGTGASATPETIATISVLAADFAANDVVVIEISATSADANTKRCGIQVRDGTNTYTMTLFGASNNNGPFCWIRLKQGPAANTQLHCEVIGQNSTSESAAQTKKDTATMIANWLTGAWSLDIRGQSDAGQTTTYTWKVYKMKA